MQSKTIVKTLRCALTDEDKVEVGAAAADFGQEVHDLTDSLDSFRKSIKAQIENAEAQRDHQLGVLRMGYKLQEVECSVDFDSPTVGQKTITRHDTAAEVAVEVMSADERQAELGFEDVAQGG